jgi:orotidine-5'-phosphate decarboxylase
LESGAEIYGVTVLTSLSAEEVELSDGRSPKAMVLYRARLAKLAGIDGVITSAEEVGMLSQRPELNGLKFVVPGTRSAGVGAHDQKRTGTPALAVAQGATGLVVGREVTKAEDPVAAFENFKRNAEAGLQS